MRKQTEEGSTIKADVHGAPEKANFTHKGLFALWAQANPSQVALYLGQMHTNPRTHCRGEIASDF